jgi:hypothetical protein
MAKWGRGDCHLVATGLRCSLIPNNSQHVFEGQFDTPNDGVVYDFAAFAVGTTALATGSNPHATPRHFEDL